MKNFLKRTAYILLRIVIWLTYICGVTIMWRENEMNLFMNYIFTVFGFVGMLWLNEILKEI